MLPLILASASPRRRKLLTQIGLDFTVLPSHVDETVGEELSPEEHVRILAQRKARAAAEDMPSGLIIAADTIVVQDGDILNKPLDASDAQRMLRRLSGARHEVFTGFTLLHSVSGREVTDVEITEVWFRDLDPEEILAYIASGSPMDKAGAYGIQDDFGAVFVEKIHGDYYNVVGFPLCRFYRHYQRMLHGNGSPA